MKTVSGAARTYEWNILCIPQTSSVLESAVSLANRDEHKHWKTGNYDTMSINVDDDYDAGTSNDSDEEINVIMIVTYCYNDYMITRWRRRKRRATTRL